MLRKTENREEWRKLVVKSTVVPQQSARQGVDKIKIKVILGIDLKKKLLLSINSLIDSVRLVI